jgi:D-alanyl-D-alanine carboxypeptidase (penicillin-binding protein 5/6)
MAIACGRTIAGYEKADAATAMNAFVDKMNDKAQQIGMSNSHFLNPDGYPKSGMHSTPKDMASLGLWATDFPEIMEVVKTQYKTIETNKKKHSWTNTNRLIREDNASYNPAATGMKTGSSDNARTLLFSANEESKRMHIVGAAMNVEYVSDETIWSVANATFDFTFENFEHVDITTEANKVMHLGVINHSLFESPELELVSTRTNLYDILEKDHELVLSEWIPNESIADFTLGKLELKADVAPNNVIATAVYTYNGEEVARIPYMANKRYIRISFVDYLFIGSLMTVLFVLANYLLDGRKQKMKRSRNHNYVRQVNKQPRF